MPRDTLEITSRELERHICEAVIGLLGGEPDEHAVNRLALPGALGGCGLRMDAVGLAADAAFWSTWAMTTKVAPGIAREAGLGKVPAADEQAAAAARARLAEAGVADGRVAFSQTQRDMYAASPWNQDLPVTGNSLMIGPTAEDNEELAVTGLPCESHPQARGSIGSGGALEYRRGRDPTYHAVSERQGIRFGLDRGTHFLE